jgi:L-arabinose isomerase
MLIVRGQSQRRPKMSKETHAKFFPKCIPHLIDVRRKWIVARGSHHLGGGESTVVLLEWFRGHSDLFVCGVG